MSNELSRRAILAVGGHALLALAGCGGSARTGEPAYASKESIERVGDRDAALRPGLIVDAQTHIWWREGGVGKATERGQEFLDDLALKRGWAVGKGNYHISDMNRALFLDDLFIKSDTDVAFLNAFGMKGAFDGVDLFAPQEAAKIRAMAPERLRVLGTVDPPDGQSAVDSLIHQCENVKLDGFKLYPPGPDARGWAMDDEKLTFPLFEVLRKYGVKTVCVHTGFPGCFLEEHCKPKPFLRAAKAFPDLNFVAFHSAYPFDAELADEVVKSGVKNVYAELGLLAALMVRKPERFAELLERHLRALGEDKVLWGTDTPTIGGPQWQLDAFMAFQPPPAKDGKPWLTDAVKQKILGDNAVKLFGLDPIAAKNAVDRGTLKRLKKSERDASLVKPVGNAPGACHYK
jgi:predicted TIM-barrel fold metal-dependent hydrolase